MLARNVWVAGFLASVIIALVLLLAGSPIVTAADQLSAANAEVKIDNFSFGPQEITVPVGATVTWTNRGRYSAYLGQHRRCVQVQSDGYR